MGKSVSKTNFDNLLEEAETNFKSSRYENAAKTFEHIAHMCIEMKYFEDMLYFTYRAIVSWIQANKMINVIRLYQKLAIHSLKLSTLQAITTIDSTIDLENKADLIRLAQQNLKHLNENEKRRPLIDSLVTLYEKFGDDYSLNYNEKIVYLERSIELLKEIQDFDRLKSITIKLACLIETNAIQILKTSDFDAELVSAHKLIEAAKLYFDVEQVEKFNTLIAKALELYPEIDLTKFNLPQIMENY